MRILFGILCISIVLVLADYPSDPYAELGLKKTASAREIKRAYKTLAKEW